MDTFVFRAYPNAERWTWKRGNRYFVLGENSGITIGGGRHAALRIGSNFSSGVSQESDTFENEILSSEKEFKCGCVEVWAFEEF